MIIYQKGLFAKKEWINNAIVVGTHEFNGVQHTSGIVEIMRSESSFFKNVFQVLQTDQNPHESLMYTLENHGANMLVFNSHGSPEGFHSIELRNKNIQELKTFGNSFPFIHGAACSTGTFDWSGGDCFAEAILKTGSYEKPSGAIGMLAFSCSTSPGPAMLAQRIAFNKLYYKEQILTIGQLCYFSELEAMDVFDIYASERLVKHWHLFGDCSALLWKKTP